MSIKGYVKFKCRNCDLEFKITKGNLRNRSTIECPNCQNEFCETEKIEVILDEIDSLFNSIEENKCDWHLTFNIEN